MADPNGRGCKDGGPPETWNILQLSRLEDALKAIKGISEDLYHAFWASLPQHLRMDYNYSKWTYVPPMSEDRGPHKYSFKSMNCEVWDLNFKGGETPEVVSSGTLEECRAFVTELVEKHGHTWSRYQVVPEGTPATPLATGDEH